MLALGVLISGRGSNLQAVIDAIASGELDAEIRVVLSNRADAAGLERAEKAGIPTAVVDHKGYRDRQSFDAALIERLQASGVEWVLLAGFMRIVTPLFLQAFPNRVVNIHPSLLPAFPGVDAQAQALAHGVRITGCTVHLVNEGVDAGPILAQAAVAVALDDTPDSLAARILVEEHRLLVETLQAIAENRLIVETGDDGRTRARMAQGPDKQ
ncbi:MAG TPA: phosphoribosylglycinamide formyltransferase [Polyangiaceae bacterium]|jgi:phosphoribosylglycinamide formyltransferase-1|nr:phosphoribosylglycinamide formyltransferase [Polyangiaceae bacterium]